MIDDLKIWLSLAPGFVLACETGWYILGGIAMAVGIIVVLYFAAPPTNHDG